MVSCRNVGMGFVMSRRKILKLTVEVAFHVFLLFVCLKPAFWIVLLLHGILYVFTKEPAPFLL